VVDIVTEKKIRATNIFYMSDSSELRFGMSRIRQQCETILGSGTLSAIDREIVRQLDAWLESRFEEYPQIFVACFTEKANDLNQWRSYTPAKLGVCIGFDGAPITDRAMGAKWLFVDCIYDAERQGAFATAIITASLKNCKKIGADADRSPQQSYFSVFDRHAERVLHVAARLKHAAYSDEKEWRLLSPHIPHVRDARVKYRTGDSMLVPFVEIEVSGGHDEPLDILEIYVGPTPHVALARQSIAALVSGKVKRQLVIDSGIPYRIW